MQVKRYPTLFISHGAPNAILNKNDPTIPFLQSLSENVLKNEKPKGILCISAHWEESEFTLTTSEKPTTIHDFNVMKMPKEMNEFQYPAKTSPELIDRVRTLFKDGGVKLEENKERGFDHGCWMPLILMYPDADIPVVQLSLHKSLDAKLHYKVGQLLEPLRDEGYLIFTSGGSVHNLETLFNLPKFQQIDNGQWAKKFDEWLINSVTTKLGEERESELFNYPKLSFSKLAHPTDEHLMPVFVSCGASRDTKAKTIYEYWQYPFLSLASFKWD
eukprot:gene4063-5087_t